MDLGQSRRGVDMGPSAARYAGLQGRLERLGHTVFDEGNVPVPNPEEDVAQSGARRLKTVTAVCQNIYDIARKCVTAEEFAIFLGGDHSISIGSIAAAAQDGPVGVVWVDAHGDFNTPQSSPSGNIHGMPVAALVGEGAGTAGRMWAQPGALKPSEIVQIGIRDLDAAERERLASQRHPASLPCATWTRWAWPVVARQALDRLRHLPRIHVSLDMDSLDPDEAPGVGTAVPGGLSYREAHLLMEILGDSGRVQSLDIVEINPILDDHEQNG
jgi:arginase